VGMISKSAPPSEFGGLNEELPSPAISGAVGLDLDWTLDRQNFELCLDLEMS